MTVRLIEGDCLRVLPTLEAGSVDLVLADPPYGRTDCQWDSVIPLAPMWLELKRLLRPGGAVVLTGCQPFATDLIVSNRDWFRYDMVWRKNLMTGHGNAKHRPMRAHEHVFVFAPGKTTYNPQMTARTVKELSRPSYVSRVSEGRTEAYGVGLRRVSRSRFDGVMKHPGSVLDVPCVHGHTPEKTPHPTQKPVALMEYLVRTYTNEGDTVLDFCAGSGSTGVACIRTGRHFIGVELDPAYHAIAARRIKEAQSEAGLFKDHRAEAGTVTDGKVIAATPLFG